MSVLSFFSPVHEKATCLPSADKAGLRSTYGELVNGVIRTGPAAGAGRSGPKAPLSPRINPKAPISIAMAASAAALWPLIWLTTYSALDVECDDISVVETIAFS